MVRGPTSFTYPALSSSRFSGCRSTEMCATLNHRGRGREGEEGGREREGERGGYLQISVDDVLVVKVLECLHYAGSAEPSRVVVKV